MTFPFEWSPDKVADEESDKDARIVWAKRAVSLRATRLNDGLTTSCPSPCDGRQRICAYGVTAGDQEIKDSESGDKRQKTVSRIIDGDGRRRCR